MFRELIFVPVLFLILLAALNQSNLTEKEMAAQFESRRAYLYAKQYYVGLTDDEISEWLVLGAGK
jgi:hypothetical protein